MNNPHKPYSIEWYAFRYNIALAAVGEGFGMTIILKDKNECIKSV